LRQPDPDEFSRRDALKLLSYQRLGVWHQNDVVFTEAAGLVQQHPYGDLVPERAGQQPGQIAGDRRVEPDAVLAGELQHRGGDEGLGDTADPVPEPRPDRPAAVEICDAGGQVPRAASVAHLGEHARHTGRVLGVQQLLQNGAPARRRGRCCRAGRCRREGRQQECGGCQYRFR
jgi:hypothetical protein